MPLRTGNLYTPQEMVVHLTHVLVELTDGAQSATLRDGTTGAERTVTNINIAEVQALLDIWRRIAGGGMQIKHAKFDAIG